MNIQVELKAKLSNIKFPIKKLDKLPTESFILLLGNKKEVFIILDNLSVSNGGFNQVIIKGTSNLKYDDIYLNNDIEVEHNPLKKLISQLNHLDMLSFDGLDIVVELLSLKFYDSNKNTYEIPSNILYEYNNSKVYNQLLDETTKYVIYDEKNERFLQTQILLKSSSNKYIIQLFDTDLKLLEEIETDITDYEAILNYWQSYCYINKYHIVKGLNCDVLVSKWMSDSSNGGISSQYDSLYLIGNNIDKVITISDIRKVVSLQFSLGSFYCKPLIKADKHYMMGGNFLFTSDSRFRNIVGYPIPIHDRIE